MKPINAHVLVHIYHSLSSEKGNIVNDCKAAGITQSLQNATFQGSVHLYRAIIIT